MFNGTYKVFTKMDRYSFAKKRRISYFVEDEYENALRLSKICEIVFLVKQPYNIGKELPFNVIPVENINELEKYIL